MSVLPRTCPFDKEDADVSLFDPFLNFLRNELRTVVALDRGQFSMKLNELIEHANDIERGQVPCALDPQSPTSELIDDGQEPNRLPVRRLVRDEVVAPDMVRILGRRPRSEALQRQSL